MAFMRCPHIRSPFFAIPPWWASFAVDGKGHFRVQPLVHQRRRAGLTLLEVLCVTAIAAIMMGAMLGAVTVTARGAKETRAVMRAQRVAGGVERILRRDLTLACALRAGRNETFIGRPTSDVTYEPVMEFFTLNSLADAPDTIVRRVAYTLKPSEEDETRFDLYRRETPYHPNQPPAEVPDERLAAGILAFAAQYHDGALWRDQWQRDALPHMLRLTLTLETTPTRTTEMTLLYSFVTDPNIDPAP
jgi:prepilin-type N-terminal cleavage/methylation domain-containing protein